MDEMGGHDLGYFDDTGFYIGSGVSFNSVIQEANSQQLIVYLHAIK